MDDHQTANAGFLANINAAKICPQATMTPESLKTLLEPMLNRQLLMEMAVKARRQTQQFAIQFLKFTQIKNRKLLHILTNSHGFASTTTD